MPDDLGPDDLARLRRAINAAAPVSLDDVRRLRAARHSDHLSRRPWPALAAAAVVVALVAGVAAVVGTSDGVDGRGPVDNGRAPATQPRPEPAPTVEGCDLDPALFTTDAKSATLSATTTFLLDRVLTEDANAEDCVDSITFQFHTKGPPAAPPYTVEYRTGPFADSGSGRAVDVAGSAFLVVRFSPAAIADLDLPNAPLTYVGPRTITPTNTRHVRQLALFDAFEGQVGWVIGLDSKRPFLVKNPFDLVVISIG